VLEQTNSKPPPGVEKVPVESCRHCGDGFLVAIYNQDDVEKANPFCCQGCKTVWNILHDRGLENYYNLKGDEKGSPVASISENFQHYDQEEFKNEYVLEREDGSRRIDLYLEGVHCLACLWLIEKIPQFVPGVKTARLSLESSRATFTLDKSCPLSLLASEVSKLGYKPHPIKRDDDAESFRKREERTFLIRIGVAMACMGNIMILSISNYGGADGSLAQKFNWISFFLALPVVFYSAVPFYVNAWSSLKRKVISIDLPVAIAIVIGTIGGLVNIYQHNPEVYFDSLTSLIFLLLLGRYVMIKARQKGLDSSHLEYFNSFGATLRKNPVTHQFEEVLAKYLKTNDLIKVLSGEIIPVDGEVIEGSALINASLLTGESLPQTYKKGSHVFSGTVNVDGEIIVQVKKVGKETRVGRILEEVEEGRSKRAPLVNLADKWARVFVTVVLGISAGLVLYFSYQGQFSEGIMRAISLIIVTCPCALALATPLALTRLMGMLGSRGIVVRSEAVVEDLAKVKKIFLDKTGTLTKGRFQVSEWISDREDGQRVAKALELKSSHPIANAIKEHLVAVTVDDVVVENWKEIPGVGVEGYINGHFYQMTRNEASVDDKTAIVLKEDASEIAKIFLKDSLREDSKKSIGNLKDLGVEPHVISGDNLNTVKSISTELGISDRNIYAQVSPEDKLQIIKEQPQAVMVGDGANDAMALDAAAVGVAVKGSMDISLKAADVYLTTPGISGIVDIISVSRETMSVIIRNLIFSVLYNFIGAVFSITGLISPLWAAVLMPLSSLTVLISTIWGTRAIRNFSRRNV
jgi:Cu2+-exporting ATPase/Cu+-exporting ATPase